MNTISKSIRPAAGRLTFFLITALAIWGCASAESVNRYYARMNLADGINKDEAKLIGKKHLIESVRKADYQIIDPDFLIGPYARKHAGYWFVMFHSKKVKAFFQKYLVVVDKNTGAIAFAGEHDYRKDLNPVLEGVLQGR